MTRILGIGIGFFIIAALWVICLAMCLCLVRKQHIDGVFGPIGVATIVTIILVFFPRETPTDASKQLVQTIDSLFIPRFALLTFAVLSLITGLFLFLFRHCVKPVHSMNVDIRHGY